MKKVIFILVFTIMLFSIISFAESKEIIGEAALRRPAGALPGSLK